LKAFSNQITQRGLPVQFHVLLRIGVARWTLICCPVIDFDFCTYQDRPFARVYAFVFFGAELFNLVKALLLCTTINLSFLPWPSCNLGSVIYHLRIHRSTV